MSDESDVLAANRAFYDAFARGDADAMEEVWALALPVACMHPGWDVLHGRDEVLASWRSILAAGRPTEISAAETLAFVLGDTAVVLCHEQLPAGLLVATNVFVREHGRWRMVHHQAAPVAAAAVTDDAGDEDVEPGAGGSGMLN